MSNKVSIRYNWIKGMYVYTIVGAGGFGLAMIISPSFMRSFFNWPDQDPIVFGIVGSVYLAFGLLSILGLRSPLKFLPVLMLQLIYKIVWFVGIILPLLISGMVPSYGILYIIIFATYVIGDIKAIPFSYLLKES